jgi:pre-mRNA-processing factor 40
MPVPIPYQHQQQQLQLQQQQQQLSVTPNNNNYTGYQQAVLRVANTSNLTNQSHDQQQQFQSANTAMLKNNIQLRLQQQQLLHQKQAPAATTTMTQSSISVPPVTNNITKTPTVQEVDEAWKEYTAPGEGGVKYYHNELLKESTYHKPDVLKKKEQAINDPPPDSRKTSSPSQKRTWQEYEDSNTGKCYYSDGVSTTWEKPDGYVSPDTIVANTSLASEREERNNREPPSKKKKRSSTTTSSSSAGNIKDKTDNGDSFANKKEATAAFKGLLLAKAISPTLKWNEVLKVCESDSRWESLEEILSIGERKQALAEYQTKRINEIRNEQRRERVRAKEAFGQLLKDVLPSVSGFSARTSRFIDVRNSLSKDDRFYAVEDEATRESLFLDFCDEYKKREERNKPLNLFCKKEKKEVHSHMLQHGNPFLCLCPRKIRQILVLWHL